MEEERLKLFYERDVALFDRLYADDLVFIIGDPPSMQTKKDVIKGSENRKYKVSHVSQHIKQVRVYGDSAVVNGTMSVQRTNAQGEDDSFSNLYTHVWNKRDGRWQLVSVHRSVTEIKGKPVTER